VSERSGREEVVVAHRFPEDELDLPRPLMGMRRFALDGALLLFDRRTGLSAVCEGPETAHLEMRAPRVVQFGITNACNLACTFCSRDLEARSSWTIESAFEFLRDLDAAGTLEVAFGGGEPLVWKGIGELVRRLATETQLAVSLTTNGTRLSRSLSTELAPHIGQLRLSLYDDVDATTALETLVQSGVRFGVNYLVTPERLPDVETRVLELAARGCSDLLLLSYNGARRNLHLTMSQAADLATRVALLGRALEGRMVLKLDVCWGERMQSVPRLFNRSDCGAGREFVVVTSDRELAPCSFHHVAYPVTSARDLLETWTRQRDALSSAARDPGCARAPGFGLIPSDRLLPLA
jgi:MoaA/NifB/PqqE/SkfB family radical SAM enzyme